MSNKDIKIKSISGQCYISSPLKTWENFGFSDVFRGYKKHWPEMGQICQICSKLKIVPVGIYLLKANDRNTRTRSEICSKLTLETPKRRHWLVNFEHVIVDWVIFTVSFKHIRHINLTVDRVEFNSLFHSKKKTQISINQIVSIEIYKETFPQQERKSYIAKNFDHALSPFTWRYWVLIMNTQIQYPE